MNYLIKKKNKGLTMLELLVAIAIFVIVITLVVTLFLSTLKGYKKNLALQNIQNNARFLLDFITKELRMSKINNPNGASSYLSITRNDPTDPSVSLNITYFFSENDLVRSISDGPTGPINSDEVITSGRFYVLGIGNDNIQPRVTIVLKVENKGVRAEEKASITLQATLSQREVETAEL